MISLFQSFILILGIFYLNERVRLSITDNALILFNLTIFFGYVALGYGLLRRKRWGISLLAVITGVYFIKNIVAITILGKNFDFLTNITHLIFLFWLYPARAKFEEQIKLRLLSLFKDRAT